MERREWLAERRIWVEHEYTRDAPTYDDGYDPVTPVHRRFVDRLIGTCPADGKVLDAACGTGPYMGIVLDAGRQVVGADQSAGMLARAKAKHPDVQLEHVGLQELAFQGEFDAAMCIDAMEHVPPEDWPPALRKLRQALRSNGYLYHAVEDVDRRELARVFDETKVAASGRRISRPACAVGSSGQKEVGRDSDRNQDEDDDDGDGSAAHPTPLRLHGCPHLAVVAPLFATVLTILAEFLSTVLTVLAPFLSLFTTHALTS